LRYGLSYISIYPCIRKLHFQISLHTEVTFLNIPAYGSYISKYPCIRKLHFQTSLHTEVTFQNIPAYGSYISKYPCIRKLHFQISLHTEVTFPDIPAYRSILSVIQPNHVSQSPCLRHEPCFNVEFKIDRPVLQRTVYLPFKIAVYLLELLNFSFPAWYPFQSA
jgi:hypothetical protein